MWEENSKLLMKPLLNLKDLWAVETERKTADMKDTNKTTAMMEKSKLNKNSDNSFHVQNGKSISISLILISSLSSQNPNIYSICRSHK